MSTNTSDQVHINHYCSVEGCGKWGGWGYARSKHEPIQWWCYEHFPYKDDFKRRAN